MDTILVNASRNYNVHIGSGLLAQSGELIRAAFSPQSEMKVAIVSDDIVAALYLAELKASLLQSGFSRLCTFTFSNGEGSKTLATVNRIYEFLAANSITRSDLVIALGGGVVGDAAGFAASTFLRGVRFVQIPTTLLAQVDSSVGGKTAVDLPCGKNLVGTFFQPSCVVCDPSLLSTLSAEIFADGMAEVLKYSLIGDEALFHLITGADYHSEVAHIIFRCVSMKRNLVQNDEFDTGERMLLNFGHTLGHAIEKESNYTFPHGSAVAVGMVMITRASVRAGISPVGLDLKIEKACKQLGLPTTVPYDCHRLVLLCKNDKKRIENGIQIVLLNEIGKASVYSMNFSAFETFLCEANV